MSAGPVLLQSLGNGVIFFVASAGSPAVPVLNHSVYVIARATPAGQETNPAYQVTVYATSALSAQLTQPLSTGSNGAGPGGIPGWVAGEQSIDLYDATTGQRQPAEPVSIADLIGSDGHVGGAGSLELPSTVATVSSGSSNKLPIMILPLSGDSTGVADRTTLAAMIAELGTPGGIIQLPPGSAYIDNLSALAGTSNIWLRGSGDGATTLIFTSAGGVADLTGASFFTCSDMLMRPSVQRTAEFFHLDAGGGSCQGHRFQRLRVASAYRLATLLTTTQNLFEDIKFLDYNVGWPWNAGIALDGTATSTIVKAIRGGTAAGMTNALVNITGAAVDTFLGEDWDLVGLSGQSMSGLNVTNGEWIRLANISCEAGTAANAATITSPAKGITMHGVHLLGLRGLLISGGKGIQIVGGEVLQCQQEGIYVSGATGALQDLTIADLDVSDCGLQTNNTYPAIHFTGGFSYFKALGCSAGNNRLLGSANRSSYGIQIDAGSDYYVVANNQCEGATGGVLDNGGGAHKTVTGNI